MSEQYIIIADDIESNRWLLTAMFENDFNILEAANGRETIELIENYKSDIVAVMLDLYMPEVDGFAVLEYMKEQGYMDSIPVLMITADDSNETRKKGYEYGVSDIIQKPFEASIAIKRAHNIIELFQHRRDLENKVVVQEEQLVAVNRELQENNESLIEGISSLVEFRSLESGEHVQRVKQLTEILLKYVKKQHPEYGLTQENIDLIVKASALHDIGKIGISDAILCKPGKLTAEEFETMKTHTTVGCEILMRFITHKNEEFYQHCYDICRYHHERWDGGGYPDHLKGKDIPLSAQLVAIVDVYDALVSKRVYKDAFAHEEAMNMIRNGECGVFSPLALESIALAEKEFKKIALG